jgi:hypothetical protein
MLAIVAAMAALADEPRDGQREPSVPNNGDTEMSSIQAKVPDLCVLLADHWSYTGIGWSYGLKSCAQSVENCLAMADYSPSVKTGINLDALAYALIAESYPETTERLKRYLKEGKVEIVGGSYAQPMGSMISGESNVRQLTAGQQTIHQTLGIWVSSFLEEEEFTHPQLPQLLRQSGYRYASTAQCDTWGKHGSPPLDVNVFLWRGLDGTCIPATPINGLVFHPPAVTHDIDWLWSDEGRGRMAELRHSGMPLAIKWTEFGWGPDELEGTSANKFRPALFRQLSETFNVRYVTLSEYLEAYGQTATKRISWRMDDFRKLLPWGVGGDQLRRKGRAVEALLLAAERFDAAAGLLGLKEERTADLDQAWKHVLIAQSHDVSLCEYEPGLSDPAVQAFIAATGTAEENRHVTTWGTFGFRHLEVAQRKAEDVLRSSLCSIAAAVDTAAARRGEQALVVFNPAAAPRDAVVATVRLQFQDRAGAGVAIRDAQGARVPVQVLAAERTPSGELVAADVAFQVRNLPAFGYDTYYVERAERDEPAPITGLKTSVSGFRMENEFVHVELDATHGAIVRLISKVSGQNLIDGARRPFPVFDGRPNREHPAASDAPERYDSRHSQAKMAWLERGPLRAVVKAVHAWPRLQLEQFVTLQAGEPFVEVRVRVLAEVPPKTGEGKINGWQFSLEIEEGYWFSFAPAFTPTAVIRDFPFGVEAATKNAIDALTFMDLVGAESGLLIVHGGTQYFKRTEDGVFANLVLREWQSHFVPGQYGWPRVAEYRYRLVPHGLAFTNADRLRCVEAFDQGPICLAELLHPGPQPLRRCFAFLDPAGVLMSSFRAVGNGAYELRLAEQEGRPALAHLNLDLPVRTLTPCDFLGWADGPEQTVNEGQVAVSLAPWRVQTFRLDR